MGNSPSSPLESCLTNALTSRADFSLPNDLFYQLSAVKPYNTAFSITPAAVTRPRSANEVAAVVKCAADQGLKVQPRSGGHSYADFCIGGQDGAVVVDLTHFQQFSMDTTTWHATIGGGTLLGDVTKRLHDNGGRAMAHGTCPQVSVRSDFGVRILCLTDYSSLLQVGIGGTFSEYASSHANQLIPCTGHATIGGLGPASRLWGSALDHVLEVEVVLANSTITRASETLNKDIFFVRVPLPLCLVP